MQAELLIARRHHGVLLREGERRKLLHRVIEHKIARIVAHRRVVVLRVVRVVRLVAHVQQVELVPLPGLVQRRHHLNCVILLGHLLCDAGGLPVEQFLVVGGLGFAVG